jgi:hypothetical protein
MTISWTAVPPPSVGRRPTMRGMAAAVPLYGWSACLGILQDSLNTGRAQVPRLRDQAAHSRQPQERAEAKKKLARIAEAEQVQQEAQATVGARLDDRLFLGGVAGLGGLAGLNGGEEFLSYMNLAESLAVTGDEAWRRWDSGMTESLNRLQNADGSWTGSHCITGRTFCTAAVLLTLTADRTPVPVPARTTTSSYSR